jgi:hypothetical protein
MANAPVALNEPPQRTRDHLGALIRIDLGSLAQHLLAKIPRRLHFGLSLGFA